MEAGALTGVEGWPLGEGSVAGWDLALAQATTETNSKTRGRSF
jgi:hypothetical protein